MDTHPFLNISSISVHPCKHATVMKFLVGHTSKSISIESYFLYFLKFVSCIIPNMDFDFTSST